MNSGTGRSLPVPYFDMLWARSTAEGGWRSVGPLYSAVCPQFGARSRQKLHMVPIRPIAATWRLRKLLPSG